MLTRLKIYLPRLIQPFQPSKASRILLSTVGKNIARAASQNAGVASSNHMTTVSQNDHSLHLVFEDGKTRRYPFIFLRDNCQCPKCLHPTSKQRLFNTPFETDINIKPKAAWGKDESVVLEWDDGHISEFSHEWLRERTFPATNDEIESKSNCGLTPVHWGNDLQGNIPKFSFADLVNQDTAKLAWLDALATTGLALIHDAPTRPGVVGNDIAKITGGYIKDTHYGEIFTVKNKVNANNLAYTVNFLPLHVDLPFYKYQPGVQLLHCIQQATEDGGESHFLDGFSVATQLKESNPEAFEILTSVKFMFNDVGSDIFGEFDKQYERPIIGLDLFGKLESISHNHHVRSSYINAPADVVQKAYRAYFTFVKMMYEPNNMLTYKMVPGDIVAFNNQRVLHGRAAFNITSPRWLEGCYFDWDEVFSSIRILRKRMGIKQF